MDHDVKLRCDIKLSTSRTCLYLDQYHMGSVPSLTFTARGDFKVSLLTQSETILSLASVLLYRRRNRLVVKAIEARLAW